MSRKYFKAIRFIARRLALPSWDTISFIVVGMLWVIFCYPPGTIGNTIQHTSSSFIFLPQTPLLDLLVKWFNWWRVVIFILCTVVFLVGLALKYPSIRRARLLENFNGLLFVEGVNVVRNGSVGYFIIATPKYAGIGISPPRRLYVSTTVNPGGYALKYDTNSNTYRGMAEGSTAFDGEIRRGMKGVYGPEHDTKPRDIESGLYYFPVTMSLEKNGESENKSRLVNRTIIACCNTDPLRSIQQQL